MVAVKLTLIQSGEKIALPNQNKRQNNMDKCFVYLVR